MVWLELAELADAVSVVRDRNVYTGEENKGNLVHINPGLYGYTGSLG
jgi:hypothetical protein